MRFGPVAVAEAEGAIAAHSVRFAGGIIKKGTVVSADQVAALARANVSHIVVARLDVDDVHENDAATQLAETLVENAPHLTCDPAFTGRVNVRANGAGLVRINKTQIDDLNKADPAITVATLADWAPVDTHHLVATVKIIPFAVANAALQKARQAITGDVVSVLPYKPVKLAHISTVLPGLKTITLDKTRQNLKTRLAITGATLADEVRVPHEEDHLAAAIAEAARSKAQILVVFAASAISDVRDTVPAALRRAGGAVHHLGMPVDPGNLLMLGSVGAMTVVGAPGCARSAALNGFDWVLQRLLAGAPVTPEDIMAMGAGGLLKEISSRPQPRGAGPRQAPDGRKKIAILILAAGQSRRMGKTNKLLARIDGEPMIRIAAGTALDSRADRVLLVTGHEADKVRDAVAGLDVPCVYNAAYATGLASSIGCGIKALASDGEIDAAIVMLADMPTLDVVTLNALMNTYHQAGTQVIVVPTYRGKRGNPVLWPRRFFSDLAALEGDAGGKALLGTHKDFVTEIVSQSDGILVDIDTPQALFTNRGSAI